LKHPGTYFSTRFALPLGDTYNLVGVGQGNPPQNIDVVADLQGYDSKEASAPAKLNDYVCG